MVSVLKKKLGYNILWKHPDWVGFNYNPRTDLVLIRRCTNVSVADFSSSHQQIFVDLFRDLFMLYHHDVDN